MASRDLTSNFLERRSAALLKRRSVGGLDGDGSSTKLMAGASDLMLMEEGQNGGSLEMTSFSDKKSPAWVDDVESVKRELSEIQRWMAQLQSLHASRVGSVFGKDLNDMETRIETMTRDITDRFRVAERRLQKVGALTKRAGGEEAAIGANVMRNLAKQLQQQSVEFRQSQRKYLAEVSAQKGGDITGDTKFGIDLQTNEGDFFTTQQVQVVDDLQEAIQSRDQEISKIAQSIEELGAIFKELAVLVIDQGTILDRIDYNMEAVVEHTKTGIVQLEKAEKAQKNARPMKCILCLISLIAILLFLLILKHRRRRHY
jgi:syntaxin 16